MNDDTINDLKQFISATVSQETSQLRQDIRQDIRHDIRYEIDKLDIKLSKKIDDLSQFVAEAMDNQSDATQTQLDDHEKRITKLETNTSAA